MVSSLLGGNLLNLLFGALITWIPSASFIESFLLIIDKGKCESACSANARITTTENGLQKFTFKQLHAATGGFGTGNVVGHGGFGSVYRGTLPDGRRVAVKSMDRSGKQGEEEFRVEVG